MKEQELKEKIIGIVLDVPITGIKIRAIIRGEAFANNIAEALIAAGIGDVNEYKHRAEVVERALLFLCDKTMSDISVMVFPSTKTQVQNKQELYDYCIKQAEKEIAEERKGKDVAEIVPIANTQRAD